MTESSDAASGDDSLAPHWPRGVRIRRYSEQIGTWPASGRHILAQFDDDSIVVYQAFGPAIAQHAVEHQRFGGAFSYERMSWIKPNFLWMMYRSGWATKQGQERILAVMLPRAFFDEILRRSVPSTFDSAAGGTRACWADAVTKSDVRLQWDPDHDPNGARLTRRALQLGLRGDTLRRFGDQELVSVEDITTFVAEQRPHADGDLAALYVPEESVYLPADRDAALAVGIDEEPRP